MRPIKFRAFHRNAMLYEGAKELDSLALAFDGRLVTAADTDLVYVDNGAGLMKIMQWTGLKDRNGKDIYEGDIVRLHCGGFKSNVLTATIEWDEYKYRPRMHDKDIVVKGGSHDGKSCSMSEVHSWSGMHSCFSFEDDIEVLGNIYQNKELL